MRVETGLDSLDGPTASRVPTVEFGGVRLRNWPFVEERAPREDRPPARPEDRIVGILGYDALRSATIGIALPEHRLWAWPPGRIGVARTLLYGSSEDGIRLSRIQIGKVGLPVVNCQVGGERAEAVIDTGSHESGLSSAQGRRLGARLTPGPVRGFRRLRGVARHRTALLNRLEVGGLAWDHPAVQIGSPEDEYPTFLGVSALFPLRRIVLDFTGGGLFVPDVGPRIGFLDGVMSFYEGYDLPGTFPVGSRLLPTSSILSINAVSTAGMGGNPSDSWSRSASDRAARLRFSLPGRITVRYLDAGKRGTLRLWGNVESGPGR